MTRLHVRNALIARRLVDAPVAIRFGVGVAAVIAGILVIFRPTASLDLLALLIGLGAIIEGALALWETAATQRWRIITASLWGTAGVVLTLLPWLTVGALIFVVSFGLGIVGVTRIVRAFRSDTTLDARVASATFGVAAIVFGVVAWVWSDVSMIIVGVVFGAWLIITGVDTIWRAVRKANPPRRAKRAPGLLGRFVRTTTAVVTVAASVLVLIVTVTLTRGTAVTDVFYADPRHMPDEPGQLIAAEPFTRGVPEGARGWRILYSTSDLGGEIIAASALVVEPDDDRLHAVISWAHGTTGYAQPCAPSLLPEPFKSGGMYALRHVVAQGWALVQTDYPGLGTETSQPYLVGQASAYAVLDATRAARQIDEANLSRGTVLWGHSQGGHATLWASQLAASYAPDLRVLGAAAVSPAGDLPGMVRSMESMTGGAVLSSYVMAAYQAAYPDVRAQDYLRPGTEFTMREYANRCLSSPGSVVSVLTVAARAADPDVFATDPRSGALGSRLRENVPTPARDIPLLMVTGLSDPLIEPRVQADYATFVCSRGVPVDYRTLKRQDHVSMLYGNARFVPELVAWTNERFNYRDWSPTCNAAEH